MDFDGLKLGKVRSDRSKITLRDYIRKSGLYPAAVNVCNRGKEEENVYNVLSLQFLSAVVPAILS